MMSEIVWQEVSSPADVPPCPRCLSQDKLQLAMRFHKDGLVWTLAVCQACNNKPGSLPYEVRYKRPFVAGYDETPPGLPCFVAKESVRVPSR